MKEHRIILEDLKRYLKGKGINSIFEGIIYGSILLRVGAHSFAIFDGQICTFLSEDLIVSLADPDYKEKFHKFIKNNTDKEWWDLK